MVESVETWRRAGRIGAAALATGISLAKPGAALIDIAEEVEGTIRKEGGQPSFPVNLSIDDQAAHYTPFPGDARRLKSGEILKIDVGAHLDGYVSDTAATVEVGTTTRGPLLRASREALEAASKVLHGGIETRTISEVIQRAINGLGFKPVSNLTGHNIERYVLHAGKSVPNTTAMPSVRLEAGEIVAIEPFATNGEGMIYNGPFGNILRFRSEPPKEKEGEMAGLYQSFRTLPFCLRWVRDEELRRTVLTKRRYLQVYPVFLEVGKGLVSQAERTFLLTPEGAEVLT